MVRVVGSAFCVSRFASLSRREVASEFALETAIRTWPIGDGDRFKGVLDVPRGEVTGLLTPFRHSSIHVYIYTYRLTFILIREWRTPRLRISL